MGDEDGRTDLLTLLKNPGREGVNIVKNRMHLIILGLGLVAVLALVGCSGQEESQGEAQKAHTRTEEMESRTPETQAQAKDPVCGMTVSTASTHNATYQGRTYYFCASGCKGKFVEDPEKYLSQ